MPIFQNGASEQSFEDLAAFDPTVVTLTGGAEPETVMSVRASANLFALGRGANAGPHFHG